MVDRPRGEVGTEPGASGPILGSVKGHLASTALVAQAAVLDQPPLDARVRELEVKHDLARRLGGEDRPMPDPVAAAFRALLRPTALDVRVDLQPPLTLAQF